MVLLVLALLWGIVLVPPALRVRAERHRARSVYRFRRNLAVLAPPEVPRAVRAAEAARPVGAARSHVALIAAPKQPPAPEAAVASGVPQPSVLAKVSAVSGNATRVAAAATSEAASRVAASVTRMAERPAPLRTHAQLVTRRRQVLAVLLFLTVATAAGVTFSEIGALRYLQFGSDVALVAYAAMLRRLRRLALERKAKVRYLPTPAVAVEVPTGELELDLRLLEAEAAAAAAAGVEDDVALVSAAR